MERLRTVKGRCSVTYVETNQLGLGPRESLLSTPWICFCLLPKPTIWGVVQMVSLQGAGGRLVREGEGLEGQEQVAIGSSLTSTNHGLFPCYLWFFFLSLSCPPSSLESWLLQSSENLWMRFLVSTV